MTQTATKAAPAPGDPAARRRTRRSSTPRSSCWPRWASRRSRWRASRAARASARPRSTGAGPRSCRSWSRPSAGCPALEDVDTGSLVGRPQDDAARLPRALPQDAARAPCCPSLAGERAPQPGALEALRSGAAPAPPAADAPRSSARVARGELPARPRPRAGRRPGRRPDRSAALLHRPAAPARSSSTRSSTSRSAGSRGARLAVRTVVIAV